MFYIRWTGTVLQNISIVHNYCIEANLQETLIWAIKLTIVFFRNIYVAFIRLMTSCYN